LIFALNVEIVVNKKKRSFVKSNKKSVTFAQNYVGNKKTLSDGPGAERRGPGCAGAGKPA